MKKSLTRAAASLVATLMTTAAVVTGMGALPADAQQSSVEQPDNYTWLEDIHGEKPMAWVKAENEPEAIPACAARPGLQATGTGP